MVGEWFAGGLLGVLIVLLLAASGLLATVRWTMQLHRRRFSPMVRQGLVNLQRPGNQSAAVLTALGLGVMLMMTIYYVQHAIVQDLQMNSGSPTVPNVFLVDVGADELAGVKKLIAAQPAVKGGLETIPIVSARILSLNGVPTGSIAYPALSETDAAVDRAYLGRQFASGRKNCGRTMVEQDERHAAGRGQRVVQRKHCI